MIADYTVNYQIATGRVLVPNPLPQRAIETRAKDPKKAAYVSGVGRISWADVESYSAKDIADFKKQMEIGSLLRGNTKTDKPRETGRLGIIKGLALAPHYYPNLLHSIGLKPPKDIPGAPERGALASFDKRWFNAFNGRDLSPAAKYAGAPANQMVNFCHGSSVYCRQTCLVLTGQNPNTNQASRAKMKMTYALLSEPALFTALLHKQLRAFAQSGKKRGFDAVVRLNVLSDLPWYTICPELLEALEGEIYFYDYTKNRFWESPDYQRVAHLLDLTYSYSGTNDEDCVQALQAGHRVAVAFAPADKYRSTAIALRTTWQEILASGIVTEVVGEDKIARNMTTDLFGDDTGTWQIVDGDASDYRIDDPSPSIVALNFKEATVSPDVATYITKATEESREHFAKPVPDPMGWGYAYAKAKAKHFWRELLGKGYKKELEQMDMLEVIRVAHEWETGEPWTPNDVPETPDSVPADLEVAMAPIEGTNLLVGPHVPIVVND